MKLARFSTPPFMILSFLAVAAVSTLPSGESSIIGVADTADTEAIPESHTDSRSLTPSLLSNLFTNQDAQQDCVRDEANLRSKLKAGGTVILCPGSTIPLTSEIDIGGMRFDLRCGNEDTPRQGLRLFRTRNGSSTDPCTISGNRTTRLFKGGPALAKFRGIVFREGKAPDNSPGGALALTDGSTEFAQCQFIGNQAIVRMHQSLVQF
jgi:hypothetical protein